MFPFNRSQTPFWNLGCRQWYLESEFIQCLPGSDFLACLLCSWFCIIITESLINLLTVWIQATGPQLSRDGDRIGSRREERKGKSGEVVKMTTFKKYAHYKIINWLIQWWTLFHTEMLVSANGFWIKLSESLGVMFNAISSVRKF
jgi:hypothetical protein